MYKETVLHELEEIVGEYKGISTNKLFTTIEVDNQTIMMENETPSTKGIVTQLKQVQKGCKIGILKIGGSLRVRMCGCK